MGAQPKITSRSQLLGLNFPFQPTSECKRYILVVEDMHLLSSSENADAYVLDMNKAKLNALYIMLTENLLIDSIFIDNIPFCKDGKIAFIDTEHFNNRTKRL